MKNLNIRWNINNWTNQGPGSVYVHCIVTAEGFEGWDERPGIGTNSGNRVRYNTFEKFMDLLDMCKDCVKRIKEGPQEVYSRVRESVSVYESADRYGNIFRNFYKYGSTSPRHRFNNEQDDFGEQLVRMIIDYIENVTGNPPASVIRDCILDTFSPKGES